MAYDDANAKEAALAKKAGALRIYEYEDGNGIVFWSFTYLPHYSVRRLTLVDARGSHFRRHISDIQEMAFQRRILEEEEG